MRNGLGWKRDWLSSTGSIAQRYLRRGNYRLTSIVCRLSGRSCSMTSGTTLTRYINFVALIPVSLARSSTFTGWTQSQMLRLM